MADRLTRDAATASTIEALLADPAATFAVRAVARRCARRDCVNAAVDARTLCTAFEAVADQMPGGAS